MILKHICGSTGVFFLLMMYAGHASSAALIYVVPALTIAVFLTLTSKKKTHITIARPKPLGEISQKDLENSIDYAIRISLMQVASDYSQLGKDYKDHQTLFLKYCEYFESNAPFRIKNMIYTEDGNLEEVVKIVLWESYVDMMSELFNVEVENIYK